jgi:serine phosphatase RsbU (regulator of sigma subunit)
LRALVEVARTLQSSLGIQEVLASVVDAALTITGMERGFLLLRRANGELAADVARDCERRALPPTELRVPMGIIRRALESRRELLTMTFDPYSDIDISSTIAQLELRAVVCVPLVRVRADGPDSTELLAAAENTAGVIYLDSRANLLDLSGANRELLQTLALEASTVLENARLLEEDRTRRKLQEEMGIARTIQQNLLPRELPREGWFRAYGSSLPAAQVGGDYFDARTSPHGWTLVVADVSGKGVSSALLASLLQGAFLAGGPIVELLRRVNAFLLERTQGEKYATIFYVHLLPDGLLEYANTGIGPPLLVRGASRQVETLDSTAMPLGMMEDAEFDVAHARLEPGDLVLAYSDGVEDARSTNGEPFGKKRVRELLERMDALDPLAVHDSLRRAVLEHARGAEPDDDITIVAFGYHPS